MWISKIGFANWFSSPFFVSPHLARLPFKFFPTSQVTVVRFYHSCSSPSPSPSRHSRILLANFLANHHRQASRQSSSPASDRCGHFWTSTASFGSQWASLDLNRQRRIPVGTPGPQPPASELSGHPWTSTASFRSQWAPLDLNDQILSPNIIMSQSIITKHHHKASSQYIITKHHHKASSQIIITDHHHKTSSQTIFTNHYHRPSSQSIITNHYHRSFSQSIITQYDHKTLSQNIMTIHHHKASSQYIITKYDHKI